MPTTTPMDTVTFDDGDALPCRAERRAPDRLDEFDPVRLAPPYEGDEWTLTVYQDSLTGVPTDLDGYYRYLRPDEPRPKFTAHFTVGDDRYEGTALPDSAEMVSGYLTYRLVTEVRVVGCRKVGEC